MFCLDWRTERDGETVPEWFLDEVRIWRDSDRFDARTKLAAEFAELFAQQPEGFEPEVWERLRAAFTEAELVELAMSVGVWLTFGRLNHVFGLDAACELPSHALQRSRRST